jgi:hypothetical protein
MVNKSANQIELYPLGKIKTILRQTLSNDSTIQELILGENNEQLNTYESYDILMGDKSQGLEGQIKNNLFIKDTQDETKTFILMDSYSGKIEGKLKQIIVAMYIFSHNSLLTLSDTEAEKFFNLGLFGNRVDCLIDQVSRVISNINYATVDDKPKSIGIGKIQLASTQQGKIYQPNDNYYGKTLIFEVWDF